MLTQEKLKEYLHYNPDTGLFTWLKYKQRPSKIGSIAGTIRSDGYRSICFFEKQYFAHRLAWLYMMGIFPAEDIDHIDNNRLNNKWNNLRACNQSQNNQNYKKAKVDNSTQFLGVSYRKESNKYRARIMINGKSISIGDYDTAKKAHEAYLIQKRKLHEFCTI